MSIYNLSNTIVRVPGSRWYGVSGSVYICVSGLIFAVLVLVGGYFMQVEYLRALQGCATEHDLSMCIHELN